ICWLVMLALLGGPRFVYRAIRDHGLRRILQRRGVPAIPVLLVGISDSTHAFIREMARDPEAPYEVVGIVAERAGGVGREVAGAPVRGTVETLPEVVDALERRDERPQRLIVAARGTDGATVRRLLDLSDRLAIPLARLPRMTEFQATDGEGRARIEPVAI